MAALTSIADDYHRYRQSTDHLRLLWSGDLEHLEAWEDYRPEAMAERRATLREFADRADECLTGEPDVIASALAETVAFTARSQANQLLWRAELELPNPEIGLHARLLTFLPRYALVSHDDGRRYHTKLSAFPDMLASAGQALLTARDTGILPITRHLTATIAAIDAQLARPVDTDPLLLQQAPEEMSGADAEGWAAETARLVADAVRPALGRYRDILAEVADRGRSDDRPGLAHLPGGAAHYEDLVWSHISLERSAEAVHRVGLEQIERLEDEYRRLAAPFAGSTDVQEIYRYLREEPSLRYRLGSDIVADATAALARAESAAPDWFRTLPVSPCVASEIAQGALAFYSQPDPDAGKPGRFFFNTSSPEAWGTFQLEAVTFHESIPGHHLQLALLVENDSLHPVHADLPVTAHSEGWGLYSERLADEMGLYTSDVARIGMLGADSMRACRLVVDTGMHALGWSRDRAIEYVMGHSPLSRRTAEGEIDRYIGMPGQALSYMMGRLEIDRLRSESEVRSGAEFDIRDFHDRVLRNGRVPLPTLRRLVLEG